MKTSGFSYHQRVSYDRAKMTGHFLDWAHQPRVYKRYPGIEPISLPQEVRFPDIRLSSLLKDRKTASFQPGMDLRGLSRIFRLSYSLTAKARHSGGDFYYRSVASAGALYPAEIYVATEGVTDLQDGLYHFSIAQHALSQLRQGAFFHPATLTFFITAIFFRSAWKYRERSYRYHLLDTGHVLENLILALHSLAMPHHLTLDFDDEAANRLLGVDETREVCLTLCSVPRPAASSLERAQEIAPLANDIRNQSRVSEEETAYPEIQGIHTAGTHRVSLSKPPPAMISRIGPSPMAWHTLEPLDTWPEKRDYAEAVFSRRSRRNFVKRPMPKECLSALLEGLCADDPGVQSDRRSSRYSSVCTGFLVGSVEGFASGFYLLDTARRAWGKVQDGFFMDRMARICLDQMWLAHAAVHFIFLSNLEAVDNTRGPRGYRYAMLMAGRLGERLYLMAEAMGLGGCGIGAFYDREAAELLRMNPTSQVLYIVAVGPVKSIH